jgi:hypothetical protein
MNDFDVNSEINTLKIQTKMSRKKRYGKSRLDKYKSQLNVIHNNGATIVELQRWLRRKRIKVEWSTVSRWLTKNG